MARWRSIFSEDNFVVHYKPGNNNILADALSRHPDYDSTNISRGTDECSTCVDSGFSINEASITAISNLPQRISDGFAEDAPFAPLVHYLRSPSPSTLHSLPVHIRARAHRYQLMNSLLYYRIGPSNDPRVAVPTDDELRHQLMHEFHDVATDGHLGRDKTYHALSRYYFWPHMYKCEGKWIRTCGICQRNKSSAAVRAPLQSLPIPTEYWESVSMSLFLDYQSTSSVAQTQTLLLGDGSIPCGPLYFSLVAPTRLQIPNETDGIVHKKHHEIASSTPARLPSRCSLPSTTPPATPRRRLCSDTDPAFVRSRRIEYQMTLSSPSPLSAQNESSPAGIPRRKTKTQHGLERCDSIPSSSDFSRTPPRPLLDSDGSSHCIVDKLLDHSDAKTRSTTHRYLVRWLGLAPVHDTWEPRARLLVDIGDS
uniref:Reverse transcriptase putative n=1 Tax=Albugo laibachii Nc14 TaxID=890382 RepID=F0WU45_9STRA|nr:reverse transcriptase putative [Albugo laibachii Nc14]|eukprot:CCA24890.1 reverse transcriptase putative [Albugo laibachii Nc14]